MRGPRRFRGPVRCSLGVSEGGARKGPPVIGLAGSSWRVPTGPTTPQSGRGPTPVEPSDVTTTTSRFAALG